MHTRTVHTHAHRNYVCGTDNVLTWNMPILADMKRANSNIAIPRRRDLNNYNIIIHLILTMHWFIPIDSLTTAITLPCEDSPSLSGAEDAFVAFWELVSSCCINREIGAVCLSAGLPKNLYDKQLKTTSLTKPTTSHLRVYKLSPCRPPSLVCLCRPVVVLKSSSFPSNIFF